MSDLTYILTVTPPNEIDPGVMDEINEDAQEHDTTLGAKIARWIGGDISQIEDDLAYRLPDGWEVRIYAR